METDDGTDPRAANGPTDPADHLADAVLDAGRRTAARSARRAARAQREQAIATRTMADELAELGRSGAAIDLSAAAGVPRWRGQVGSWSPRLVVLVAPGGHGWWAIDPASVVTATVVSVVSPSPAARPLLLDGWASTLDDALEVLADDRAEVVLCSHGGEVRGRVTQVGGSLVVVEARGPAGTPRRTAVRRAGLLAVGVLPPAGRADRRDGPGQSSASPPLSPLPTTSG